MALPSIYTGPLDRNLAELGVYNTGSRVPRLPGVSPGIMPPTTGTGGLDAPYTAHTVNTGGGLQASVAPNGNTGIVPPNVQTGGGLPPQIPTVQNGGLHVTTGGPLPPVQGTPTGTPAPTPTPANPAGAMDVNSILNQLYGANGGNAPQVNPADLANQYMMSILGADSPYIQSARQAGLEAANSRGLLNSSIAAGASQRAAVDAAMPMFQNAYQLNAQREQNNFQRTQNAMNLGMQLVGQRENNAFQGNQNELQRTYEANQNQLDRNLKQKLQSDSVYQQNWLQSQDFTRQFNAALSMIPIQTATQFSQLIQQYALDNPDVYTPEVISGMTTFFTQQMGSILKQYFPSLK